MLVESNRNGVHFGFSLLLLHFSSLLGQRRLHHRRLGERTVRILDNLDWRHILINQRCVERGTTRREADLRTLMRGAFTNHANSESNYLTCKLCLPYPLRKAGSSSFSSISTSTVSSSSIDAKTPISSSKSGSSSTAGIGV